MLDCGGCGGGVLRGTAEKERVRDMERVRHRAREREQRGSRVALYPIRVPVRAPNRS